MKVKVCYYNDTSDETIELVGSLEFEDNIENSYKVYKVVEDWEDNFGCIDQDGDNEYWSFTFLDWNVCQTELYNAATLHNFLEDIENSLK